MSNKISSKRRKLTIASGCSPLEHSLAAEIIVSNVDLLTAILLCVPAKSLIRFKCVSKHWLSLITDLQFACNHTRRNSCSLISGLYFYKLWSSKEQVDSISLHGCPCLPTLAFLNGVGAGSPNTPRIVHSCNGLVLLWSYRMNYTAHSYIVCNPTTQKYTVLPQPGGTSASYASFKILAFDPSKSPHYKVVLVTHSYDYDYDDEDDDDDDDDDNDETSYQIEIYSSESASWKRMRVTAPPGIPFRYGAFCNGAIHWMSDENVHIQFDADTEKLTGTPLPPKPKILDEDKIRYFGECCGLLLLIQTRLHAAKGFNILEMDGDYSHWIAKYRVNLRPVISVFPEIGHSKFSLFSVLCVVKGANEKDYALVLAIPGKVISYNLKCKTMKVLHDLPRHVHILPNCDYKPDAYKFIETLSPV